MILLATNERDITTDFVVLELRRRGLPFIRLNTENVADARIRLDPAGGWTIETGDRTFAVEDVRAAYYRRPEPPAARCDPSNRTASDYCVAEWSAVLRSLWNALEGRWLNSPFAIGRAEDKPRQLGLARSIGFQVPETLVTNDPDAAAAFVAGGACVGKPLRHALLEDAGPGRVIFTNRVPAITTEDREGFALAPVILQREVRKAYDVRATVVGDRVFAARIDSQATTNTEVDWRRGSDPRLGHAAIELPEDVVAKCVAITAALGLRFGAIDLVRDRDGVHWFLEINPNGQWAWIEKRTGLPIAAALVDLLGGGT